MVSTKVDEIVTDKCVPVVCVPVVCVPVMCVYVCSRAGVCDRRVGGRAASRASNSWSSSIVSTKFDEFVAGKCVCACGVCVRVCVCVCVCVCV